MLKTIKDLYKDFGIDLEQIKHQLLTYNLITIKIKSSIIVELDDLISFNNKN